MSRSITISDGEKETLLYPSKFLGYQSTLQSDGTYVLWIIDSRRKQHFEFKNITKFDMDRIREVFIKND